MEFRRNPVFAQLCCLSIVFSVALGCNDENESVTHPNVVLNQRDLERLVQVHSSSSIVHLELGGDLRELDMHIVLRLENLESINIYGSKKVDAFSEHVKELPQLKSLTIQASDLTDEGLQAIVKSRSLRELRISENNVRLSREVVERIQATHRDAYDVLTLDIQLTDEPSLSK